MPPHSGGRPAPTRKIVITTEKTPSVITAFEIDVTTRIHGGTRALVSRYPFACSDVRPVFVPSAKKSHRNNPTMRFELVGGFRREEKREHAHQDDEHRQGLEQRPDESAERAVVPRLEIGADQRPDQAGRGRGPAPVGRAAATGSSGGRHRRTSRRFPNSSSRRSDCCAGSLRGSMSTRVDQRRTSPPAAGPFRTGIVRASHSPSDRSAAAGWHS